MHSTPYLTAHQYESARQRAAQLRGETMAMAGQGLWRLLRRGRTALLRAPRQRTPDRRLQATDRCCEA
jgi:hypothetical protein